MAESKERTASATQIETTKLDDTSNPVLAYQDISDEYPAKKRRRLLLKMDLRILPLLMLLYCEYCLQCISSRSWRIRRAY
jgi:hypothetical protein